MKLAIDEWYVRRASPRLDAQVTVALMRRVLPFLPSTHLPDLVCPEVPESREVRAETGSASIDSKTDPVLIP